MFYDFKAIKIMKRNKKSSIWAIEQVCTIKIVETTTPFILLGTQVPWSPWSPGTQTVYLSFQWSKWAGEKKSKKKPGVLNNFCFLLNFESQILIDLMTAIRSCAFAAALKVSSFSSKLCTSQKIICHLCMHNVGWKDQTRFNA